VVEVMLVVEEALGDPHALACMCFEADLAYLASVPVTKAEEDHSQVLQEGEDTEADSSSVR
jgi:hypothetical protein